MRRKRKQKEIDRALLDTFFTVETNWKNLQQIHQNSVDPMGETLQKLQLSEAMYIFLLKEAKHRKISVLRY